MTRQTSFYPLRGGLNLVTPAVLTPPGHAIAALNYESHPRGYRRIDGFERLDGRPSPSQASYWVLRFRLGGAYSAPGDLVVGATSGASGTVLTSAVLHSGTYSDGDAAGYLVLTEVSGTFQAEEALQVGGNQIAEAAADPLDRGAETDEDDRAWLALAIERRRSAIEPVPGSGPVRGVWSYAGDIYAFRDNEAGTAGVMYRATPTGWQAVDLGYQIAFEQGDGPLIVEGETVTGGTSGASATIRRAVVEHVDPGTHEAAGRLILGPVSGGPFLAGETLTAGDALAEAASAEEAITLPPGGRYDFVNHNFYGNAHWTGMYGANGVGPAFEWDGQVFVPLHSGMADDRPTHIAVHRNHLFLAFRGGSLQHSSLGNPYQWQVVTGAGEIGIGEEITGLLGSVAGALSIFGRNKVAVLVGEDAANWVLNTLSDDSGAVEWTAQRIGPPVYLDDGGLRSMETTDAFGDFRIGTLSQMVEPLFEQKRRLGLTVAGSLRVREKDQYRLFWSDGSGIALYFGRQPAEVMPFHLGVIPTCLASCECVGDMERLLMGSADGWVYELDAGTSFDGQPVRDFLRLPFNHVGSPSQNKRWLKAVLEVDARPRARIGMAPEFSYGDPDQPPGQEIDTLVEGSGGFWNEMFWDRFYWSSQIEGQAECPIDGIGTNLSLSITSEASDQEPHVIHGMLLHYTARGIAR